MKNENVRERFVMRSLESQFNRNLFQSNWRALYIGGLVIAAIGLFAFLAAELTTIKSVFVIGLALVLAGGVQFFSSFSRSGSSLLLGLVTGIFYFVAGTLLLARPFTAVLALTMLIGFYLISMGIYRVILSLTYRFPNWGWMTASGAFSVWLGVMVITRWASAATWVIGAFIGLEIFFYGVSLASVAKRSGKLAPAPPEISKAA